MNRLFWIGKMYQIVTFWSAREPQKLKMVGNTCFFMNYVGPFKLFITCLTEKIGKFWLITLNLSAFLGIKRNDRYIFHLLEELKVMGC